MNDRIYIAFLISAARNSATFATFTEWKRSGDGNTECRGPSILPAEMTNKVLYEINREVKGIKDWPDLYRWLSQDENVGPWAFFTEESALRLVPHWFSNSVELICRSVKNGPVEFIDVNSLDISEKQLEKFHGLTGVIDSLEGQIYTQQIRSNLVLTTLPIFID